MAVELAKEGEKLRIDLSEEALETLKNEEIKITLNWSDGRKGFFGFLRSAVDLDLGCFIELEDGSLWCIDGLQFSRGLGGGRHEQSRQGSFDLAPYVWHYGDVREGGSGETIFVNPEELAKIRRILVYTFIYDGVAQWAQTNAVATLTVPGIETVEIKMGQQESDRRFCALASFEFARDAITIEKLVTFFNGHKDCARAYNWNFKFTSGSKE